MSAGRRDQRARRGNPWRATIWGTAAALLLLPAAAMRVTDQVNWGAGDFAIFALLLFTACAAYELVALAIRGSVSRVLAGLAIVAAFLLVWVELAVGIIGPG